MKKHMYALKLELFELIYDRKMHSQSAQIGAGIGLLAQGMPVMAQGFIKGFGNMNTLLQLGVGLLVTLGLLGGLGMILGGLVSAYKKYDRGNDDVTWAKISMQVAAGGFAMALGWVGMQVVETLGGSSADIGRSIR